jgi:Lon protease-like protein
MANYLSARSAESERIDRIFDKLEIERIVNYLCASLPLDVLEKQSLLDCATVEQRYRRLCEVIDFKTAEARLGLDSARDVDA